MTGTEQPPIVIVDDRAGFYMVPTAAITKARERLSGAHLAEGLAGLACLARESFLQHGATRDAPQTCEANLDTLAGRILGVSRARALRILDNLVDAGALTKDAHRFNGTRRLPTKITFVDCAYSFAYVSGPAFRALRNHSQTHGAPFGTLALYLTLVALGGEQRDEFPDGNRRIARASQPELAKLSGLSVSSVKRAVSALVACGLVAEHEQPEHALKTKTIYHLIDPERSALATAADSSQPDRRLAHHRTADMPHDDRPTIHSRTDDRPPTDRPTDHSATAASPTTDRPTTLSDTKRPATEPARAPVKSGQNPTEQQNNLPLSQAEPSSEVGEGEDIQSVDIDSLVSTFYEWTRDALGDRRASAVYDATAWQRAAADLLAQYDLDRLLAGIDRLRRDSLLADKATTLPAFANIAERAIARAAADRRLAEHRVATTPTPSAAGATTSQPPWASACDLIRQAVSAFGPGGHERAMRFLADRDPHVAAFAQDVGWRTLTRSDDQMTDVKYAYLSYSQRDRPEAA